MLRSRRLKKFKTSNLVWSFIIHFGIVVFCYFVAYNFSPLTFPFPDRINVVHFDAYWYYTINTYGYFFEPGRGNNLAFFPFFPLFWRTSEIGSIGISFVNYLIFVGSFYLLLKDEQMPIPLLLALLLFPSNIFFALPYSESFFFLFCTLISRGYKDDKKWLIYFGLFGASTVRSVCMIFLPAIVLCDLMAKNGRMGMSDWSRILYKLLTCVIGLTVAMAYVYYRTHTWFYFIEIQKYWNRHWIMPHFPLTTLSPERVLAIDAVTFILALIALMLLVKLAFSKVRCHEGSSKRIESLGRSDRLFALLYIVGMTIMDSCFTSYHEGQTSIWSLNRHVMATPFALVFLVFLYRHFHSTKTVMALLLMLFAFGFFFTGISGHPSLINVLFYLTFSASMFIVKTRLKWLQIVYFSVYICLLAFLQISFYGGFLTNHWLG